MQGNPWYVGQMGGRRGLTPQNIERSSQMIDKPDAYTRMGPRMLVALAAFVMLAPHIALGGYATFDSLAEGSYGDTLSMNHVPFDTLRLAGVGPMEDGIFVGSVDNVLITPEPSTLILLVSATVINSIRRHLR